MVLYSGRYFWTRVHSVTDGWNSVSDLPGYLTLSVKYSITGVYSWNNAIIHLALFPQPFGPYAWGVCSNPLKVTKVAEIENDLAEVKKNQEEHQTLSSETLFQKMNELIQDTYSSGKFSNFKVICENHKK